MASGDLLKQLFRTYKYGDNEGFEAVAWHIVDEEKQKNHHILASELQRILANGQIARLDTPMQPLPHDRETDIELIEVRRPQKYWPDVILAEEVKTQIERVLMEFRYSEVLRTYNMRPLSKLLFCGPPGCGKTLTAEVIAGELDLPLLYTRFDSIISSLLGQTATNLRQVFDYAAQGQWVIFFDEFDAIGKSRNDPTEHGELKRVVNTFLQLIDSFSSNSLIIASTNHEGLLDRALWRRFDDVVYFDMPTIEEIPEIVRRKLASFRHDNLRFNKSLLNRLDGFSHADIERLCFDAIKEAILDHKSQLSNLEFERSLERQLHRRAIVKNTSI